MVSFKSFVVNLLGAEAESIALTGVELFSNLSSLITGAEAADEVGSAGGQAPTLRQYANRIFAGDFSEALEIYKNHATEDGVLGQRIGTGVLLLFIRNLLKKSSLLNGKSNVEKLADMVVS